jgi:hypothetical protein
LGFGVPATAEASTADIAAPAFRIKDRRPAFGCFGPTLDSDADFEMATLYSFHFRLGSEEVFHIATSDMARNSPDDIEGHAPAAAGEAEIEGASFCRFL